MVALYAKYNFQVTFQNFCQEKASWKVGARDVAFVLPRKESGEYWDKLTKGYVCVRAHAHAHAHAFLAPLLACACARLAPFRESKHALGRVTRM